MVYAVQGGQADSTPTELGLFVVGHQGRRIFRQGLRSANHQFATLNSAFYRFPVRGDKYVPTLAVSRSVFHYPGADSFNKDFCSERNMARPGHGAARFGDCAARSPVETGPFATAN